MATTRTIDRLRHVSTHEWDRMVGDDGFYLSYDWLRFVESDDAQPARYVIHPDVGAPEGALPLYRLREAPGVRYRAEHFRDLLGLRGAILIAGGCRGWRSTLLLAPGAHRALPELLGTALSRAAAEGYPGVVLPFLTTRALLDVGAVAHVRAALDTTEAEIQGCADGLDAYAEQATSRVRKRIRSDRARFAEACWTVQERKLDECWRDAARLLHHLERKYGHTGRTVRRLERSLERQVHWLAPRSVVFTCEDDHGPAGVAVAYRWRDTLFGRFVGFDYERLRGGREYFNLAMYARIAYAGRAGIDRLHLGAGSWQAKGYRGAVIRPLWSAFIPAREGLRDPGIDLLGPRSVERHMADISAAGVRTNVDEWRAPARRAAGRP